FYVSEDEATRLWPSAWKPTDIISPLPEVLATTGDEPIYKPVLYSDYVKHFYRKAHDGKLTIDFAKK
ncbi:hypothetical protein TIFTF001_052724, partial [Ficus carica]